MDSKIDSLLRSLKEKGFEQIVEASGDLDNARKNVGGFDRHFMAIVKVQNPVQLKEFVTEANELEVPYNPYSGGNNWGYGSKLPAQNDGVLLDLSALNKIIHIDEEHGLAHIETGVTQAQLATELLKRKSKYFLDVTGSGADTTILGNALERGIAYQGIRVNHVMGLEVLLADGTRFQTGFGDYPNPVLKGLYPFGVGPALDGLFFQSNLGVITQGTIKLNLHAESVFALSLSVDTDKLPELVDGLKELRRNGCIQGIPHIANRERTVSTMIPLVRAQDSGLSAAEARRILENAIKGEWTVTVAVTGTSTVAKAKLKDVKKKLKALGSLFVQSIDTSTVAHKFQALVIAAFASPEQKAVLRAAEDLRGLHIGRPSNAGVQFLMDKGAVDQSSEGFLLCTPLAPLSSESARIYNDTLQVHSKKFAVKLAMTLNIITEQILEAVISVHFQHNDPEEKNRAHLCVKSLTESFNVRGFYPYRVNIDQMQSLREMPTPQREVTARIKNLLDPKGLISPGRYD